MRYHVPRDNPPIPCPGRESCALCRRLDPADPAYSPVFAAAYLPDFEGDATGAVLVSPASTPVWLAGDLLEALAHRIGADHVARYLERKLGTPCGCAERRDRLNKLDNKIRQWLGWPVSP